LLFLLLYHIVAVVVAMTMIKSEVPYLGVDRSAMSNELSKLQREGLLTFEKNRFSLAQEM